MKIVLFFILLLMPTTAYAGQDFFDWPSQRYQIPKRLILAIAQTESGLSPWAVNVNGKSFQPRSRKEALVIIYKARAQGLSHDIGLMQINSWWLKRLNITPEQVLEPRNNASLGVWILSQEIKRYGLTWRAVGAYHSPTPARQLRYVRTVLKNLK